ncbi:MAG: hypothetical protein HY074_17335, partial [Deltaproteobacteria bacterium]|nr:hypothetical protein [Deltaproteobacteria bacterium]
ADSHKDGAISILNHPNFGWAFTTEDLFATDGFELLEIASGHFLINENGDDKHSSEEELWDQFMTKKHRVFGVAVDDSHNYTKFADTEANPGRAWIQVWAPELSQQAICMALRQGHFYASRGTKITALVVTPHTLELSVDGWQPSTDHVDFVGKGGELLDRVTTLPAKYTLRGGEGYVRAHVRQESQDSKIKRREAWTQPYFIKND